MTTWYSMNTSGPISSRRVTTRNIFYDFTKNLANKMRQRINSLERAQKIAEVFVCLGIKKGIRKPHPTRRPSAAHIPRYARIPYIIGIASTRYVLIGYIVTLHTLEKRHLHNGKRFSGACAENCWSFRVVQAKSTEFNLRLILLVILPHLFSLVKRQTLKF